MTIVRKIPWTSQPATRTQLDYSHRFKPIQALVPGWDHVSGIGPGSGAGRVNSVGKQELAYACTNVDGGALAGTSMTVAPQSDSRWGSFSAWKHEFRSDSTGEGYILERSEPGDTGIQFADPNNFCVAAIYKPKATGIVGSSDPRLYSKDEGNQEASHDLMIGTHAGTGGEKARLRIRLGETTITHALGAGAIVTPDEWHLIAGGVSPHTVAGDCITHIRCVRGDAGLTTGYSNSTQRTGEYNPRTTTSEALFGNAEITGNETDGELLGVFFFDRMLSEEDCISFFDNPWQIFQPQERLIPYAADTTVYGGFDLDIPWTKKPPAGTPLDMSHPLARDLIFFSSLDEPGDNHNLVDGKVGAWGEGTGWTRLKSTPEGVVTDIELNGTLDVGNYGYDWGDEYDAPSARLTYMTRCRPDNEPHSSGSYVIGKQDTAGTSIDYGAFWADTYFRFRVNSSDKHTLTRAAGNYQGQLVDIAWSNDPDDGSTGSKAYLWNRTTKETRLLNEQAGVSSINTGNGGFKIGGRSNSDRGFDGELHYGAVWARTLSEEEMDRFRANPWQIFQSQTRRIAALGAPGAKVATGTPSIAEITASGVSTATTTPTFSVIPRQVPWTSQPPAGTPIDWGNPLAQGLVFLTVGTDPDRDLVDGRVGTVTGTLGPTIDPKYGIGVDHDETNWTEFTHVPRYSSNLISATCIVNPDNLTGANYQEVMRKGDNAAEQDYDLLLNFPSAGDINFNIWNSGAKSSPGAPLTIGETSVVTGTYNGAELRIYKDGREYGSPTAWTGGIEQSTDSIGVGARVKATVDRKTDAQIYFVAVHNRALSAGEIKSLHENPWQIFQPQTRLIPIDYSAVTTGFATFLAKVPWTSKPPAGTPIAKSSSIARGLTFVVPFNDHGTDRPQGLTQDGSSVLGDLQNGATWKTKVGQRLGTGGGVEMVGGAFPRVVIPYHRAQQPRTGQITVFSLFDMLVDDAYNGISVIYCTSAGNNDGYRFYKGDATFAGVDGFRWRFPGGTTQVNTDVTTSWNAGDTMSMVCTYDEPGQRAEVWHDGKAIGNNNTANGMGDPRSGDDIWMGEFNSSTTYPPNHLMRCFAVWDRVLTPAEIHSLYENPWQIFEPQTRQITIEYGAVTGGVVITNVNTTNTWDDGDTGLIITGTGFRG